MIVAGIGCRSGATEADVHSAIRAALAAHAIEPGDIDALAVPEQRSGEAGIHAAAGALGVLVLVIGRPALEAAASRTLTSSMRSLAATGAPSASEAAALAAIGPAGMLLGPRIATGFVTCALASDGSLP